MGRTILCPHCKTAFDENILKKKNSMDVCLVCGGRLDDGDVDDDGHSGWITWYYYGFKNSSSSCLEDSPIDLEKYGETFYLIKEFQAPPRDENGNCDAAKRELRKYVPDAFSENSSIPKVQCPYCHSTEVQLVPKKFSILTGFATNSYNRVCVRCQRKF